MKYKEGQQVQIIVTRPYNSFNLWDIVTIEACHNSESDSIRHHYHVQGRLHYGVVYESDIQPYEQLNDKPIESDTNKKVIEWIQYWVDHWNIDGLNTVFVNEGREIIEDLKKLGSV